MSQTGTKVATSSVVVAAVVAVAGLGLLGMAAGLLPGITQAGHPNLRASVKTDKQSIQIEGDVLTHVITIMNTGTVKTEQISALQHFASETLSVVSAKTSGTIGGFSCTIVPGTADVLCSGGSLKANETATISVVTKLLQNANACGTSGTAMSLLTLDPDNLIAESDEKDNVVKGSTAVTGSCPVVTLPNLTVTNLAVASSNGLVTATLNNTGNADVTVPVSVYLYFDGEKSMTYTSTTFKDQSFLLAGGTSPSSTRTVTATTKTVKLCVDDGNAVAESDETDNCQEVTVGSSSSNAAGVTAGTDLTVTKNSDVSSAKQGDAVSYTIDVSNVGTVDAASVGLTDVFTDPFVFASATGTKGFVCTVSSKTVICRGGMIGAGKTATITVKGTIGATGLACDTTKVITDTATVDPLNKIVETNEDNNKATAETTLTNPCGGSTTTVTTTTGGGSVSGGTSSVPSSGGTVPNR